MSVERRIQAMITTATIWGVAWSLPGLVWMSVLALRQPGGWRYGVGGFLSAILQNWTIIGAISGAVFALTLSVAERRRSTLSALSLRRVISWGAIGGAVLPLVLIPLLPVIAPGLAGKFPEVHNFALALRQGILAASVYGVLGAVSAGASLQLARRVDQKLPSGADELRVVPPVT